MIDLHVHLDGSIRPQTIIELAREQDAWLPTYDVNKIKNYLVVTPDAKDRSSFFRRHDLSQAVLQGRRAIRRVVSELVIDLGRQGVMYAEIRDVAAGTCTSGIDTKARSLRRRLKA